VNLKVINPGAGSLFTPSALFRPAIPDLEINLLNYGENEIFRISAIYYPGGIIALWSGSNSLHFR
jgi:hypothetical protein